VGGGGAGTNYRDGPGHPEGGPGLAYVAKVIVFLGSIIICRLHKRTLSDQSHVTMQLTAFLVYRKAVSWSALAGDPEKNVFTGVRTLSRQPRSLTTRRY
jgi:hypothetical protein